MSSSALADASCANPSILVANVDGIAIITLNRPQVRNAIDDDMRSELVDHLQQIAKDDSVRAVVLTGAGKGFCSGGDVKNMKARLSASAGDIAINGWRRQQRTHHAMAVLHNLPKPTIAAVNGAAMGLGCDLALCCDFVMASDAASFGMTYILRGLIPDGGGMYFLPRRVGLSMAKQLIYSGRKLNPEDALQLGMIDRVTRSDTLLDDACAWARELSAGSATALSLAKTILNQTFELTMDQVFAQGSQAQAICYTSADHLASVAAFLDKSGKSDGK